MKKSLILFSFAFLSLTAYAQDCKDPDVKLSIDSTLAAYEPCVVRAADNILSKPLDFESREILNNRALVINWMDKTPLFTFNLNPMMLEICIEKSNTELMSIYLSCLSKCAINNRKDYMEKAVLMFVEYIKGDEHGVKKTSKVKKLLKAADEKDLTAYL